jgi:hypothetical protein
MSESSAPRPPPTDPFRRVIGRGHLQEAGVLDDGGDPLSSSVATRK